MGKLKKSRRSLWQMLAQVFTLLSGVLLAGGVGLLLLTEHPTEDRRVRSLETPMFEEAPPLPKTPPERVKQRPKTAFNAAALEDKLRDIAEKHAGRYGVVVLDPTSGKKASVDAGEKFGAASIGKLPTLLSLYEAAGSKKIDLDEKISILPSDVQSYGSGVLQNYPLGTRVTLRKTAFLLVNESDNTAWMMLERRLGKSRIQEDIDRLGARNTDYEERSTIPNDVLLMLQKITDHSFTSEKLSDEMLKAMTDTYLEDRIPAGLPSDVRIAHKTGTYAGSYGDAAIVFPERKNSDKHYFVVILVNDSQEADARDAMREMARASYEALEEQRQNQ